MNETRKESFRKWATFFVSTLALLVACLRDPIVFTLKGTAHEALREELDRREKRSTPENCRDSRREAESELLRRMDPLLESLRDRAATKDAEHKLLQDLSSRLMALQAKLELLTREPY